MNKYIGIFDSGIGGLTAVNEVKRLLPNESIIYFADTKNIPYGDKTKEELLQFVKNNIELLNSYDVKTIAVACNTMDSTLTEEIIKTSKVKIIGIIKPTCIEAVKQSKNKRIGVLATSAAIKTNLYEKNIKAIDKDIEVFSIPCPKLVPLVEGILNEDKNIILHEYLDPLINKGVDTIILGCTHYPLLEKEIKNITKDINLVNSGACMVKSLKDYLLKTNNLNDSKDLEDLYLVSGDLKSFKDKASIIINEDIKVEKRTI